MALRWGRKCISSHLHGGIRRAGRQSIHTIPTTPAPTCPCGSLPKSCDDLDFNFDTATPIRGTMPYYNEHVLIATGKTEWTSKIEDEKGASGSVIRALKKGFGRGGEWKDDSRNTLITASSFCSEGSDSVGVYLLPSFRYIPHIRPPTEQVGNEASLIESSLNDRPSDVTQLVKQYLLPHPDAFKSLPSISINEIMILVCSHGQRDSRCGVLGPLLMEEFIQQLSRKEIRVMDTISFPTLPQDHMHQQQSVMTSVRVGGISHIGGHVYAGNVIIYIPPSLKTHQLAGKGIWYGKVNPERVEGIIAETVLGGRVIEDILRGII